MINTEQQFQIALENLRAQELGRQEILEPDVSHEDPDLQLKIDWDGLETLAMKQTPVKKAATMIERFPDWILAFIVMLAPITALAGFKLGMAVLPNHDVRSPLSWLLLLLVFCLISFSALLTYTYLRASLHPQSGRLVPSSLVVGSGMFLVMCALSLAPTEGIAEILQSPSPSPSKLEAISFNKTDQGWLKDLTVSLDQVSQHSGVVRGFLPEDFQVNKDSRIIVHFTDGQTYKVTENITCNANEISFAFTEDPSSAIAKVNLSTAEPITTEEKADQLRRLRRLGIIPL